MICLWTCALSTPYSDVHHVFGRASSITSVKEQPSSLMCVCRACHPPPILAPPTRSWAKDILVVWRNMNCQPYNKLYKQAPETEVLNPIGLPVFKVGDGIITDWSR